MKNNTNKGNNMTKKFLTEKETEGMSLEQFAQAIREGKVEVRPEGSHEPTADQVTMNGRFGCEWVFFYCVWFVYDLHLCVCVYVRVYVSGLYVIALELSRKSFGGNDLGRAGPPPGAVSPYVATTYDYPCLF